MNHYPLLSNELLSQSLFTREGTLPIVLTVPHDGTLTGLGEVNLPNYGKKPRDMAVRSLARDVFLQLYKETNEIPSLVIQRVNRRHITPQIKEYFDQTCIETVDSVRLQNGNALHIDLHGFTAQPVLGTYDLILGTGHRKSMSESKLDHELAEFMSQKGYAVYLPTNSPIEGELYSASNSRTLVQRILQAEVPDTISLQIEIARHFRRSQTEGLGRQLAADLGDFIVTYMPYL